MFPFQEDLPDNVIVLILINLSVMQLMRMKCICQGWRQLIETPYFVNLHFHANKNNSDFFLATHPLFKQPYTSFSIYRSETLALYSSVDIPRGIFPFSPTMSWSARGLFGFYVNTVIVLCNPATRRYNVIPPVTEFLSNNEEGNELKRKAKKQKGMDGFVAVRTIGLGYSSVSNEFKLFVFVQVERTFAPCVYNLTTRTWSRLNFEFPHLTGTGVPCNGALHWTARPRDGTFQPINPSEVFGKKYTIVTCDVTKHAFGDMSLPAGVFGNNLGLVNGNLAVFDRVANDDYGAHAWCIDVWSMQQYGDADSWMQLYRVGPLGYNYCQFYWRDQALLCGSDHYNMEHRFEQELISCDLNHVIIGRLRIYYTNIRSFKESLISVDQPRM